MEPMSVYTYLSKDIGLTPRPMEFPSLVKAKDLEATVCDDMNVFREVFKYHRFLVSGVNQEQYEIQDILYLAFLRGKAHWENQFINQKQTNGI